MSAFLRKSLRALFCVLLAGAFFATGYGYAEGGTEGLSPSGIQEFRGGSAVRIECNEPRSEVRLNGIFQGRTNLTVEKLLPGEYVLTVSKPGYVAASYLLEVRKNYKLTYQVELRAETEISEKTESTNSMEPAEEPEEESVP